MKSKPQIICITGGIGSGKTLVCKILEQMGYYVFYADIEAHKVYENPEVIKILQNRYGEDIYINNQLNKSKLGNIIFNDENELQFINELIHPRVRQAFENKLEEYKDKKFIFKEAAILFESGSYQECNKIILVTAPENIRVERVIKRDKISESEVKKRIAKQLSDEEKSKKSNFIIVNDGHHSLIHQVLKIVKKIEEV